MTAALACVARRYRSFRQSTALEALCRLSGASAPTEIASPSSGGLGRGRERPFETRGVEVARYDHLTQGERVVTLDAARVKRAAG
jgi:hypothetical protein